MTERHSVEVLRECIELQTKKSNDYQNPNSMIKQADYYPSGCLTILEIMHAKLLRMRSVMEAMQNDPSYNPNFESLEDSAKDLINYASFYVAYSRGKVDGQQPDRDFLNRKKPEPTDGLNLVEAAVEVLHGGVLTPTSPTSWWTDGIALGWDETPTIDADNNRLLREAKATLPNVGTTQTSRKIGADGGVVSTTGIVGGAAGVFDGHPGVTADMKDTFVVINPYGYSEYEENR